MLELVRPPLPDFTLQSIPDFKTPHRRIKVKDISEPNRVSRAYAVKLHKSLGNIPLLVVVRTDPYLRSRPEHLSVGAMELEDEYFFRQVRLAITEPSNEANLVARAAVLATVLQDL